MDSKDIRAAALETKNNIFRVLEAFAQRHDMLLDRVISHKSRLHIKSIIYILLVIVSRGQMRQRRT